MIRWEFLYNEKLFIQNYNYEKIINTSKSNVFNYFV